MPTACQPPRSCYVDQTISESGVSLSWSGASGGTDNNINGYEIQYSESNDNASWGDWVALTIFPTWETSGWTTVMPSTIRGYYRRFRIRTRGSAGATYYSEWIISSNSVRKNLAPNRPTLVNARPIVYNTTENVTVSWSGASSPTTTIKGYQIARRMSSDNEQTWDAWTVETSTTSSSSSGSVTLTPMRQTGVAFQYGVWTIDSFNVYSGEQVSNAVYCLYSPCTPPTTFAVSSAVAEGNVTLNWSGTVNGTGNTITAYEIQYSDSTNGTTWSDWIPLTIITSTLTSGNLTVSPPDVRGHYRRFRLRVQGSRGSSYYSRWIITSNTLRKNVLPIPPSVFTVEPQVYIDPSVTLTWNGTIAGTSPIMNYVIQQSTSIDGVDWSGWELVTTVVTTLTYGTYTATPSNVGGMFTRYRIAVTDSLNAVSTYVVSNTVNKNRTPLSPTVQSPQDSSITYNTKPLLLIQTQEEPDGHPQTIYVRTTNGTWLSGDTSVTGVKTIFTHPEVTAGTYTITVEVRDDYSSSASVTRTFTVSPSPFEEIVANVTHVKAIHMNALRTAVNDIRHYYGLHSYVWADEIKYIRDWMFHVLEVRAAIDEVVDLLHSYGSTFTVEWIPLTAGRPKADVMNQLHEVIMGGAI